MNCATGFLERSLRGPWFWSVQSIASVAANAFAVSPAGWDYFSRRRYRRNSHIPLDTRQLG